MPGGGSEQKDTLNHKEKDAAVIVTTEEEEEEVEEERVAIPPLPVQVIERNRLSLAEILALPRFRDYTPGEPSKVC